MGRPKENKGREGHCVLSVNGYARLFRRRWAGGSEGSDYPIDRLLDQAEATLSVGVRELACREGGQRLVGVTREKVQGLKRLLRREAARVHLRAAAERIGSVDGAVCLRNNLENLPLEVILLDFYHLSEHVAGAVEATLGTEKGQTWREDLLQTVRHEGYEPFFQKLLDWRGGLRGQKRKAADKLIGYVASRAEMILYQQCGQRGWNVGSGPMESMCGVTTDRLKGRGRRWDLDNGEAMMALEALYQSTGLWDKYWRQALHHLN